MKFDIQKHTVFPVHGNKFKIGTNGRDSVGADFKVIKDIETFEPTIDGNVEEWNPMDTEGWVRRLTTGKSLGVTLTGKRNYGDDGNDYVAGLALITGEDSNSILEWTLPNGSVLTMPCVINVNIFGGGDSTNVDGLEIEVLSDGQPTFDEVGLAELTFVCTDHLTAGATQIESVSPMLGALNSYIYKVNGALPAYDKDMSAEEGWAAYTLSNAIPVVDGNIITLVEIDTDSRAVKGGTATAVVTA